MATTYGQLGAPETPQAGTAALEEPDKNYYNDGVYVDQYGDRTSSGTLSRYKTAANDLYGFGLDEDGMLMDQFKYDPTLIDPYSLHQAEAFDFDPMRQNTFNQLDAQNQSSLQSNFTNLAASGGLTAADRMALASSHNRNLLGSNAKAMGKFAELESKNIWETDQANNSLMNSAILQNIEMQNQADLRNLDVERQARISRGEAASDMQQYDNRIRQAIELGELV